MTAPVDVTVIGSAAELAPAAIMMVVVPPLTAVMMKLALVLEVPRRAPRVPDASRA